MKLTYWGLTQNGRHFPDNIFKCIYLNGNVWISMKISLKFVPKFRINPLRAKFLRENINIYLHFMSCLHAGSWNSSLSKTRTCLFYIINIMAADVLATQGARASATMILTYVNWVNSVPALVQIMASHYLSQWWLLCWCIHASLGLNDLQMACCWQTLTRTNDRPSSLLHISRPRPQLS